MKKLLLSIIILLIIGTTSGKMEYFIAVDIENIIKEQPKSSLWRSAAITIKKIKNNVTVFFSSKKFLFGETFIIFSGCTIYYYREPLRKVGNEILPHIQNLNEFGKDLFKNLGDKYLNYIDPLYESHLDNLNDFIRDSIHDYSASISNFIHDIPSYMNRIKNYIDRRID